MRSCVTSTASLLVGALVIGAAIVGPEKPSCHSYSLPSPDEQATKYSPHVSSDHVLAGMGWPVSGRATPYAAVP